MPVERHGSLQAQRIARAKATGHEPFFLTDLQEQLPDLLRPCRWQIELKAVLACIARTGNKRIHAIDIAMEITGIILLRNILLHDQLTQDFFRCRPLKGNLGDVLRYILKDDPALCMRGHPGKILILIGGIHDDEIVIISDLVNDEIVNHAALLIAHGTVARMPVSQIRIVVREQTIEIGKRIFAAAGDLSHMRYIEKTAGCTHSHMLGNDAFILHRQQPAGKRNDFSSTPHMLIVKRCFQQIFISHEISPSPIAMKNVHSHPPCAQLLCRHEKRAHETITRSVL